MIRKQNNLGHKNYYLHCISYGKPRVNLTTQIFEKLFGEVIAIHYTSSS